MDVEVSYYGDGRCGGLITMKAEGWLYDEFRFSVWWLLQQKLDVS